MPARFVIDAATLRHSSSGGAVAIGAPSLATPPSTAAAGSVAALGQGCFGKVLSMSMNGVPVAVKELSASTLDATSLGEYQGLCPVDVLVSTIHCALT